MEKKKGEVNQNPSRSKVIWDKYINPFLDVIMWIALVFGAYWFGKITGSCENIEYACRLCEDFMRTQMGNINFTEVILNNGI